MNRHSTLKLNSASFRLDTCIFLLFILPFYGYSQGTSFSKATDNNPGPQKGVNEEKFIRINGIEQWITIKGENSANPVILFLHGGPGSPLSPYANAVYGSWEKEFTLVQWDQRGTGRTYGRTAPAELSPEYLKANPLSVELMTADGIKVSEYIIKHLGKRKIIVLGTSWGSILGVRMAIKRPDLFYAYIGHSQVVDPAGNLAFDYQKVYKMAQWSTDQESMDTLTSIGVPPYDDPRNAGKLFRIIKKYERQNSTPGPVSWLKFSSSYDNEKDSLNRENGDDYSFVNYMGYKRLGIKATAAGVNLLKEDLDFKIPVYLVQGEEDILTPKELTKEYFDKIRAPAKKIILLEKTAHGFNQAVVDAQYKIMKQYVLPMINR